MKQVLQQSVVKAVRSFPGSGLGHALQEVDSTLRVTDKQVQKVLWKMDTMMGKFEVMSCFPRRR